MPKSFKAQIKGLQKQVPAEYDPEDAIVDERPPDDNDDRSDDDDDLKGREHYEAITSSKLRKPAKVALGKKYDGIAISREDLDGEDDDPFVLQQEDDEDEDPFARRRDQSDSDDEDQDEVSEDSEVPKDSSRKRENGRVGRHQDVEDEDDSSFSEDDFEEATDASSINDVPDDQDSDSSISTAASQPKSGQLTDREKIKALALNDAATLASSLSAAANADIRKGTAVKQQRQTFDRLVDARIKLQKGLVSLNESTISVSDDEVQKAARNAEEAALSLWATISSIRENILESQTSNTSQSPQNIKRKASQAASRDTSSKDLFEQSESLDNRSLPNRNRILNKWSNKTRSQSLPSRNSNLLNPSSKPTPLNQVLETYLSLESDKIYSSSTTTIIDTSDDPKSSKIIYDDIEFYQSLLRDLISSRSTENGISLQSIPTTNLYSKTKPSKKNVVDTKASKGRKVRYTVHEKLLNFMSSEDRSNWTDAGRREFFTSLFGGAQNEILGEKDDENSDDGNDDDVNMGVNDGLRLF